MTQALELLNISIDDIDDLPGFELPPEGVYAFDCSTQMKEINSKQAVSADFTVKDTIELNNPELPNPVVGTKFSVLFFIKDEASLVWLKKFLKPFAEWSGQGNLAVLVTDVIKDVALVARLKHRKDKTDPDKAYPQVSDIQIA